MPRALALSLVCVTLTCCALERLPSERVPYKAVDDYLAVYHGDSYQPLLVKGVNLGVGVPGTRPGELAASREDYLRWFARMSEIGVNVLRVYTLHHPRFYAAIDEHNSFRPGRPLYVLHGVWLDEETEDGEIGLQAHTKHMDEAIEEVIDAAHGNRSIDVRFGKAYGEYTVDMSRWILGWIIGREVYGAEVMVANRNSPGNVSYQGTAISLPEGSAAEAWVAARLDHVVIYERDNYGTERPVAFSSWPTLDPLYHETETHFGGESELEFLWSAGDDDAQVDVTKLDASQAPAGLFVSYHAYPYYPDFINDDPVYNEFSDSTGPNSYAGYLAALKLHYKRLPLMISEYGVSTSWSSARTVRSGMHHGGVSELDQARYTKRMVNNIYETGCAGGVIFSWLDEWWKSTWIIRDRAFPRDRFHLWRDMLSPEQHFGLVAFDQQRPNFSRWRPVDGAGRVQQIRVGTDAAYFHLRIRLATPLADGEELVIGYDSYRDDLGESILPNRVLTPIRSEFALVITAPDRAEFYVTPAYNLEGIWHRVSKDTQVYQSTATDGAGWEKQRWLMDDQRVSDTGKYVFPRRYFDLGTLSVRQAQKAPDSRDAVILGPVVEVRIPWVMLQFTDPSTLSVMHDDRSTAEHEVTQTDGIRVVVSLGDETIQTPRYIWDPWDDAPTAHEREKPAVEAFSQAINALPDAPPPRIWSQ